MIKKLVFFVINLWICLSISASPFRIIEWGKADVVIEYLQPATYISTQIVGYPTKYTLLDGSSLDVGMYRVKLPISPSSHPEGKLLSIAACDAEKKPINTTTITMPTIIAEEELLTEYDVTISASTDLVVLEGGTARVDALAEPYSFHKVVVYGGGKLVVPENTRLTCDSIILVTNRIGDDNQINFCYPEIVVNGSLINSSATIYYYYWLHNLHYFTLGLPVSVYIGDITYHDGHSLRLGQSLFIQYYDGEKRAQGGDGWVSQSLVDTLMMGRGYTIAALPPMRRIGNGEPTQRKFACIQMPLRVDLSSGENRQNKFVEVQAHPSMVGRDNDAGWNLVANPYWANYGGALDGLVNNGIGLLQANSNYGYDWTGNLRYVVIPNNNGTRYQSMLASEAKLPALKNFFVQIGEGDALGFTYTNRQQNSPERFSELNQDQQVELSMKNEQDSLESDDVHVLINDSYSADYEINADLQKFASNSDVDLFVFIAQSELVYAAIDNQTARDTLALGYRVSKGGNYVISVDKTLLGSEITKVQLHDTQLNVTCDLLTNSYSFATKSGLDTSRLKLTINTANIPTSLNDDESVGETKKVIVNQRLIIKRGIRQYSIIGELIK